MQRTPRLEANSIATPRRPMTRTIPVLASHAPSAPSNPPPLKTPQQSTNIVLERSEQLVGPIVHSVCLSVC